MTGFRRNNDEKEGPGLSGRSADRAARDDDP